MVSVKDIKPENCLDCGSEMAENGKYGWERGYICKKCNSFISVNAQIIKKLQKEIVELQQRIEELEDEKESLYNELDDLRD